MTRIVRIAAPLVALALAACVGAPAPREQFFTLAAPNPGVAPPAAATPSVFVGPVSIPAAADRTEMLLSTGPNQVDISDQYRWAESLRDAIPRVVAEVLSRELGTSRVLASRMASGTPVDYRVAIEVQRFDSSFADGATVDALWTITAKNGAPPRAGRTVAREPDRTHDAAGIAAAHARALQRVATDIANAIRALH
jgi:uncharacterized lipoprotein YmbA